MGCCYKNLLTRQRLFALHHVLERRARAKRRIVGRRNLQRRTRLRVSPRSRRARLSSKGSKLGQRHLVARAHRGADDVERGVEHSADARLGLTRLSRDRVDQGLLIQSRGIASAANAFVRQSVHHHSFSRLSIQTERRLCSFPFATLKHQKHHRIDSSLFRHASIDPTKKKTVQRPSFP